MLVGACHCGATGFELDDQPRWLVSCNCSACRRLGTLWAHAPMEKVRLTGQRSKTPYLWGDRTLAFHTCAVCGATTHWEPVTPVPDAIMAVNCNLVDASALDGLRIRHFDGADTWAFLD